MDFFKSLEGSPGTLRTYRSLVNHHILPYLSIDQAKNFNKDELIRLMNHWENLHPRTVKILLLLLNKYVTFYGGVFDFKKTRSVVSKSVPLSRVKSLTKDELIRLLETCKLQDPELYEVLMVASYTGMRRGEIFGLTYEDIDLNNKVIYIQRSYNNPYTKTRTPRIAGLPKVLVDMFQKRNILNTKDKVFTEFNPYHRLQKICTIAGVKPITIHGLRHTFATLALDSKKSLKKVQNVLGHKSLQTTLDIYWNHTGDTLEVDFI